MNITTVILDMYGVIMKHPNGGFYDYVNQKFPSLTHEEMYPIISQASIGGISSLEIFKSCGYEGDLAKIQRDYLETVEINEEFFSFAEKISKNYRLAILSNDPSEWSAFIRQKFDLNKYFDAIIISGDVGMKKPSPEIFLHTLNILSENAKNCLFVDDRPTNVEAASALSLNGVVFKNSVSSDYTGEYIESFSELERYIEAHK